jgi:hypothetical protein
MQILIKFTSLAELNRVKNANSWIRIQRKMYHLNRVFRICDIFGYESIDTTPFLCQYCIFSGMWGVSFSRDNAPSSIQRQVPVRYGNSVGDGTLQYGKLRSVNYVLYGTLSCVTVRYGTGTLRYVQTGITFFFWVLNFVVGSQLLGTSEEPGFSCWYLLCGA